MSNADSGNTTCPFCLDVINVHARRCRHCGANLEQTNVASSGTDQVVYILDRSIVRFARVSLSLLGLFAVIGAYLLGIDLKRAVQDIDTLRRQIEDDGKAIATQAMNVADDEAKILAHLAGIETKHTEIQQTTAMVGALRAAAQSDANSAKQALEIILETQGKVLVVAETLSFSPDGTAVIRSNIAAAADRDPNNRRSFKLWRTGETLSVRFIGGTADEHEAVKDAANEWSKHANIHFVFDDSSSAQIRISFKRGDGSWSYVGTDSLNFLGPDDPTMNFGWSIVEGRDTILRNFGHALGLLHEHQNPLDGLEWEEEFVYEAMAASSYWSRSATFHNIIRKNTAEEYAFPKPFDPNSIMMYTWKSVV